MCIKSLAGLESNSVKESFSSSAASIPLQSVVISALWGEESSKNALYKERMESMEFDELVEDFLSTRKKNKIFQFLWAYV